MEMKTTAPPDEAAAPAVPLGFVRSNLFGTTRTDGVPHAVPLVAQPIRGVSLTYAGPPLGQHHALLWQAVIQAATRPDGTHTDQPDALAADALLRAMGGKGNDSQQRARVATWLRDLAAARVEYRTNTQRYAGPLLASVERGKPGQPWAVRLPADLLPLLANEVLRNDLARKAGLGRNLLALWLHDYLASHLRPPPETADTLRLWCGSSLALPQFRQRLRGALDALKQGPRPLVQTWAIDRKDRLLVEKGATRVVILPTDIAQAKQYGPNLRAHRQDDINRARQQRSTVAL
jgi:hypothetical protein